MKYKYNSFEELNEAVMQFYVDKENEKPQYRKVEGEVDPQLFTW